MKIKINTRGGAWVAQPVDGPTLDFGSGHDPGIVAPSPIAGLALGAEPA